MGPTKPTILVVDDESGLREMLGILFRREGYDVQFGRSVTEGKEAVQSHKFDLVLSDLLMPDGSGLDLVPLVRAAGTEIIIMTAHSTVETAISAMKLGAYDFITKPFATSELKALVHKALEKRALVRENAALKAELHQKRATDLVGRSPAMRKIAELVARVAPTKSTVLVTGESGTGKERIARAVHQASDRADKPFLVVNCGAIPENLMESELFGHEKGAFTGATQRHQGIFREADGGTVFLDEIGELPLPLQVKLLRVLQEKKVRMVGAPTEVAVDVRVIAATNRNLEEMVKERTFREDLFYRLKVIPIEVPPLRYRRDDIPALCELFLQRARKEHRRETLTLAPEVARVFDTYPFPGNVRELENVIERAVTLSTEPILRLDDLPEELLGEKGAPISTRALPPEGLLLDDTLATIERGFINQALERSGGSRTQAAHLLGVNLRSLRYRMKKLGLISDDEEDDLTSSRDLRAADAATPTKETK